MVAPRDPFGLVGTLLERKYRVDRVVAEGGFGVVYAGHHLGLDVPIAIKALRPPRSADEDAWTDALAQFLLEAKALAKLRSPAVVTVYDAGMMGAAGAGGVPWIVLEWIEGETLHDELARRRGGGGRLPALCMDLLRGVLVAIGEAHEHGIAHRDLKPSNVMLERTKRGRMVGRVLDFGIAKIMEREEVAATGSTATAARFKAFSPAYAAPEQVSGMRTGPWTDVHALGLILTELLVDRSPYPTDDANQLYRTVFDELRPTPRRYGVDVGAWEPVLARALAIKPVDRYASAGELLAALEATMADARVVVRPSLVPPGAPPSSPAGELPFAMTERSGSTLEPSRVTVEAPTKKEGAKAAARRRWRAITLATAAVAVAAGGSVAWMRAGGARAVGAGSTTGAGSAGAAAAPACTSHAACTAANGGEASICRADRGCVALASVDCVVHAEARAIEAPNTVWFGAMFPLTATEAPEVGTPNAQAVDLARRDFAQIMGGTASANASEVPPFGVVSCDDGADPHRAAAHLVDDVGVAAIIGFRSGVEAMDLATSILIPRGVLSISATSTNPLLTKVPHPPGTPRLVWRTAYNSADTALALGSLVHDVFEPELRAPAARPAITAMRVALVRPKNAAGAAFSKALGDSLTFNGRSALANGADFRELTFASSDAAGADAGRELAGLEDELAAFLPHAILYVGEGALVERVFTPLEQRWPAARSPRPRYAKVGDFDDQILAFLGTNRDRRRRFFGAMEVSSTAENARFVTHYNETFADRVAMTGAPNTAYDAFYLLAYATYAANAASAHAGVANAPVTGASLSAALARLTGPGRKVDVGMTGIFDAFATLRRGEPIDLVGASGSLDLDAATGDAPLDQAIVCASIDDHGRANGDIDAGLVRRAKVGKLEGTLRCP